MSSDNDNTDNRKKHFVGEHEEGGFAAEVPWPNRNEVEAMQHSTAAKRGRDKAKNTTRRVGDHEEGRYASEVPLPNRNEVEAMQDATATQKGNATEYSSSTAEDNSDNVRPGAIAVPGIFDQTHSDDDFTFTTTGDEVITPTMEQAVSADPVSATLVDETGEADRVKEQVDSVLATAPVATVVPQMKRKLIICAIIILCATAIAIGIAVPLSRDEEGGVVITNSPTFAPSPTPTGTPSFMPTAFWWQVGEDISGEVEFDQAGAAVAMSADGRTIAECNGRLTNIIVGNRRQLQDGSIAARTRVFRYEEGKWTMLGKALGGVAVSVSLSADGDMIALGVTQDEPGFAAVARFEDGSWLLVGQELQGAEGGGKFGKSVSLSSDGSVLAVGAEQRGFGTGYVQAFRLLRNSWVQAGQVQVDGNSVALSDDGSILAIGSDSTTSVYRLNSNGTLSQIGTTIDGGETDDKFGWSVAISADGLTVATGGPFNAGSSAFQGSIRVLRFDGNDWVQLGDDIHGESKRDIFGVSVALSKDGSILAGGAEQNDAGGVDKGHVRVFHFDGLDWVQLGEDIDGEASGDYFGRSVALSGDGTKIVVGGRFNDGNGSDYGHVRVFQTHPL